MIDADVAAMRQPPMAAMLESVAGHWGAILVSFGLLVPVLGAYLAWSLLCAEVLLTAAKMRDMPLLFACETPTGAGGGAMGDEHRRTVVHRQRALVG